MSKTRVEWTEKEAAVRALEKDGKVDPLDLVQAARMPTHPCHEDFTWDVEQAAQEHWRFQARAIIRSCKCQILVDQEITMPVVRYVASPDDEQVFVSLARVRSVSKTSAILLTEVAQLHGGASRVYGIALSKQGIVGAGVVAELLAIREQLAAIKEQLSDV